MIRRLRDDVRLRLEQEAETMSFAATDWINRHFAEASARAAMWQLGPMPDDWEDIPDTNRPRRTP